MTETQEIEKNYQPSFEQSQHIREVVQTTIAATKKITGALSGALLKIAGDIFGMFKR